MTRFGVSTKPGHRSAAIALLKMKIYPTFAFELLTRLDTRQR